MEAGNFKEGKCEKQKVDKRNGSVRKVELEWFALHDSGRLLLLWGSAESSVCDRIEFIFRGNRKTGVECWFRRAPPHLMRD